MKGSAPSPAGPASPGSLLHRAWHRSRFALLNLALPVLLAWILTVGLHRLVYQSDVRGTASRRNSYGQLRIRFWVSDARSGSAEPLIVCGEAGQASLVFIKLLDDNRAKVGIEFWGRELDESDEFDLPPYAGEIRLTCDLPALYPEVGSSAWKKLPPEEQKARATHYSVAVEGVVRLKGAINYPEPAHAPIFLGVNPFGGSFVGARFSGKVLGSSQEF